ncbi:MAG: iron-sulfur cluster assembly accessory protein [Saprospiraceae bacterium]|nr:iron-sulfur cluster assembly accessory protein [Saprospiraceae bacterium]
MIQISDSAKERVQSILTSEGKGADYFVRVAVKSGGCSGLAYELEFDNELDTSKDDVFEDNGMKLVVDKRSVLYLFGTILDFSGGLNGKGFEFRNPNATRTCSCGESFSI